MNGSITEFLPELAIWSSGGFRTTSIFPGLGGVRAAGRWHSQGRRIVYLADHPSSALLEMLVHMDRDLIPATYQLLRIVVPADMAVETVDAELSPDWRSQTLTSRENGGRWLDRATSALLRVPSAISGKGSNFLLNPAHVDAAKITVAEIIKAPFDPRLTTKPFY